MFIEFLGLPKRADVDSAVEGAPTQQESQINVYGLYLILIWAAPPRSESCETHVKLPRRHHVETE